MNAILTIISSLAGSLGLILSSPLGPANLPMVDMNELTLRARPAYIARISDAEDGLLGTVWRDGPLRSPLEALPGTFLQAVIAIEDRRFDQHRGIDPIGLARAVMSQIGSRPRGGSSIDQQMAKNAWTGADPSLTRKIEEAVLALRARHVLGRDGVLRAYLETAWFGRGITGAAGAAQAWFGRDWEDLSLGEMAWLAGILRGPAHYDPLRHPERAMQRRNQVLDAMLREGMITREDAGAARAEPLNVIEREHVAPDPSGRWALGSARSEIIAALEAHHERSPARALVSQADARLSLSPQWQSIAQEILNTFVSRISPFVVLDHLEQADLDQLRGIEGDALNLRGFFRDRLGDLIPWDSPAQPAVVTARAAEDWILMTADGPTRLPSGALQIDGTVRIGDVLALEAGDQGEIAARGRNAVEGAVVILDPRTGALLASVGGADPTLSSFDRTRARRQPGSAIKTFLFLAALEAGYGPATPVPDFEQEYLTEDGVIWQPRNYGHSQSGMVRLDDAYRQSSNLVAAALINAIGSDAMGRMAEAAGAYPDGMRRHMTAALGTMEVSLLDLTRAHATIINAGVARHAHALQDLVIDGEQVISNGIDVTLARSGAGPIARRDSIETMTVMMREVIRSGTASVAFRDHPVAIAGKTGTTQEYRDAWFVGVTPHLAIGVWIGRDDNLPLPGRSAGGRTAAPIAAQILRQAHTEGLIDAAGFRDSDHMASLPWPPEAPVQRTQTSGAIILEGQDVTRVPQEFQSAPLILEQAAPLFREEPVAQDPAGPQVRPPAPNSALAPAPIMPSAQDPFWGVVGEQRSTSGNDFRIRNRNQDLRPGYRP